MAVVGIDFGNLNCVCATAGRGGVDVLLNGASKRQNQCAVSFQDKQRFMGDEAAAVLRSNYRNSPTDFKRLIGRKFADPEVQEELARLPLNFLELPDGNVGVEVDYNGSKTVVSMEQVTAMMLTKLMAITKAAKGVDVAEAVISVPGYWTMAQRQAMMDACSIAGLNCLRLMHDGTASALAFGIFKSAKGLFDAEVPQNVMFLDMGHASVTSTIVSFVTGKLVVKSAAYDRNLGGRDFDRAIAQQVAAAFREKHNKDPMAHPKAVMKIMTACEKAKKTLSPQGVREAQISIECLLDDIDFNMRLTIEDFKAASAPLLERLNVPVQSALAQANIEPSALSSIEIIGGCSRIGFVKEHLADLLGLDKSAMNNGLSTTLNADEAVARGCALHSAMLSTRFKVKPFNIFEAVSFPVELCWDSAAGAAAADADAPADEDAAGEEASISSAAATSVVMFQRNDETPKTRRVTFKRADRFTITARYAGDGVSELPPGVDPTIGTFTVQPAESDAVVPDIRVNIKHDIHGLLKCVSAHQMEEIKEEVKDSEGKEGEGKADAPAEGKEDEGKTEGKDGEPAAADPPKKKRYRKVPLSVEPVLPGMSSAALQTARQTEMDMAAQDQLIEDTNNARNEVESHIYAMRDRLIEELRPFCTDAEKDTVEAGLTAAEDWLYYGDGYDAEKAVYTDKLAELRASSDQIERRLVESKTRDKTVRSLRGAIDEYRAWVSSSASDEKFAHITDAERSIVRNACAEDEAWLFEQLEQQAQVPQHMDPVLKVSHLTDRHRQLQDKCRPILNKPKPQPKQEPKPAADAKDAATEDPAAGDKAADADAPAPEAAPAPEDAKADGDAEPMEVDDAAGQQD